MSSWKCQLSSKWHRQPPFFEILSFKSIFQLKRHFVGLFRYQQRFVTVWIFFFVKKRTNNQTKMKSKRLSKPFSFWTIMTFIKDLGTVARTKQDIFWVPVSAYIIYDMYPTKLCIPYCIDYTIFQTISKERISNDSNSEGQIFRTQSSKWPIERRIFEWNHWPTNSYSSRCYQQSKLNS